MFMLAAFTVCGTVEAAPSRTSVTISPLDISQLEHMENLVSFELSPDGKLVALLTMVQNPGFTGIGPAYAFGSIKGRLRIITIATGSTTSVEMPEDDYGSPRWSPDSRQLAFFVGRGGAARLAVWSRDSGSARVVSDATPRTVPISLESQPVWLSDSRRVVVAALPKTTSTAQPRAGIPGNSGAPVTAPVSTAIRVYDSAVRLQRSQVHSDSPADKAMEFPRMTLYRADLAVIDTGTGDLRRLVTGGHPITFAPSPDGQTLSYVDLVGSIENSTYRYGVRLSIVNIDSAKSRSLLSRVQQNNRPIPESWSPDGRWLGFVAANSESDGDYTFIDAKTGALLPVRGELLAALKTSPASELKISPVIWGSASEAFILVRSADESSVWRLKLDDDGVLATRVGSHASKFIMGLSGIVPLAQGKGADRGLMVRTRDRRTKNGGFGIIELATGEFKIKCDGPLALANNDWDNDVSVSADGRVMAFSEQRADVPPELFVSRAPFDNSKQLTTINTHFIDRPLGESRLVSWRGPYGEVLNGALLLPPEYSPGTAYPLIVVIYGGGRISDDINSFGLMSARAGFWLPYDNRQLLATRGYAVLLADTVAHVGHPMRDIAQSVLPAVDRLVDDGVADPNRLGIMGHSYGGYSVLSVLVQTNRFKVAVASGATANLIESYGEMLEDGTVWKVSWAEEGQGRMGGSLWEHRDRFIENSPLFYLDRVTTPILLMHGTTDDAVAVHEADEIFVSLNRLGKDIRYVKYFGEGHNISGTEDVRDWSSRMISWFDTYLKPEQIGAAARGDQ
ncbi:MAG TPA: prolyl oligopeptidase family serine peptidase [Steroidobacteraceae bacterium]|jgi:dipeptidyl aminopeptidase/acylaminoacyl peptidase|nr:prolyl oligopeptidase family serine peptidase [Steroidobacteraceae bacterium]